MKKMLFTFAAVMFLFTGCDNVNMDIDDLSRDLAIYVRQLTSVENGGWDNDDVDYQDVTSTDGEALDSTVGTVTITDPQDSYVRSDTVEITQDDGSACVFAYWLFASRTDEDTDDESTEGNIRYDDGDDGETVSLRTDNDPAELIGVFAYDGELDFNGGSGSVSIACENDGDTTADYTITLDNTLGSEVTIYDPQYRLFDEDGEALDYWEDFGGADGEDLTIDALDEFDWSDSMIGVDDISSIDSWTVIIIYEDSDGNAYVIKS